MVDSYGRALDYLRLSITDRCNLRCLYCMPKDGVEWKSHDAILSFEEILTSCRILANRGIRKIKITGGEFLVRKDAVNLIRKIKAVPGIEELSVTTNGLLLEPCLEELAAVPLSGINISLNTLSAQTFRRISGYDKPGYPAAVLQSIEHARSLGIPVKINCVPLKNININELVDIAALAEKTVDAVRFIELMPIGCAAKMESMQAEDIRAILEQHYGKLQRVKKNIGNGPAVYYSAAGFSGTIGMINAMTEGFCETCNRLRLTPEGLLKPCLSSDMTLDLRSLLRSGASDEYISKCIEEIIARKPAGHSFSGIYGNVKKNHTDKDMFRIGG
ncbi:cyclic pyranopterin monophosphate synthase [Spirochaetia bacterium]|nr:cyclic pyranopterin monophosphate synthase [Spirochaetia bacterium]